ncbi:MAG: prephenate dehydrogenase, partial [Anaerolineales bacterium]
PDCRGGGERFVCQESSLCQMRQNPPTYLSDCRVLIVGLGLMGGSLALALKGKCKDIVGFDKDETTCEFAQNHQLVSQAFSSFENLPAVDLIILAIPVGGIVRMLSEINRVIENPAVVLDIGSTKQVICQEMEKLAERFDPIGGHPMCGKERLGIQNADASIFVNAPFALVPLERTSEDAKNLVSQLVQSIGSQGIWIDAEIHDRWVAAVSHVPYLLASALTLGTPIESSMLIGSGFRSSSRLAATSTTMMADVLKTNRRQILQAMKKVEEEWKILYQLLENEQDEPLINRLDQAALKLNTMLNSTGRQ